MSKQSIKNPIITRLLVAFLLCASLLSGGVLVGCQAQEQPKEETGAAEEAPITIETWIDISRATAAGYEGVEQLPQLVVLEEGAPASATLTALGVQVERDGSYITAIDGLAAGSYGASSGWVYYVNGEMPSVPADEYNLIDYDIVEWRYVTEFTEDMMTAAS